MSQHTDTQKTQKLDWAFVLTIIGLLFTIILYHLSEQNNWIREQNAMIRHLDNKLEKRITNDEEVKHLKEKIIHLEKTLFSKKHKAL